MGKVEIMHYNPGTMPAKAIEGELFTTDQVGCARCGADEHRNLLFHPFLHPVITTEITFTHWAMCPTNGEPIMFGTIEVPEKDVVG